MNVTKVAARKMSTAKKLALQGWYQACARSEFTWRYVANLNAWLEYQRIRRPLTNGHDRLLGDLNKNGIVVTSVDELMNDASLYDELEAAVREKEALMADEIQKAQARMYTSDRNKAYFFTLLGPCPTLDVNDVFVRFALQADILSLINNYFGMLTKFRYYNVWYNFPTQAPPRESQLWHRDPEDRAVLKMFVYLTDVDFNRGPLTYAPGTHLYGNVKKSAPSTLYKEGRTHVRRSNDDQMKTIVPESKWVTAIGPRRTIVLADTRGYHKGGYVRHKDRILYTCMFSSSGSFSPEVFRRGISVPRTTDRAVAFAVSP
jgi:hypothetical protein